MESLERLSHTAAAFALACFYTPLSQHYLLLHFCLFGDEEHLLQVRQLGLKDIKSKEVIPYLLTMVLGSM